ncbi:proteoglycan 4-like isoform X1 [Salvelinus sp. IW2-2015]|uniref:proteoglycan 4-like isoform X1 n=1 Tax=Salvelinus sp. IW2-2015 TaxID=2691554 RepID=UPI000CEAAA76|nr:pistil-specific extensin-like protein isoform X1 [Salvelinus alpinus]XP_023999601.1 pistil-specific extensin-like protein isoform X1 [Salvelinus alpinus]
MKSEDQSRQTKHNVQNKFKSPKVTRRLKRCLWLFPPLDLEEDAAPVPVSDSTREPPETRMSKKKTTFPRPPVTQDAEKFHDGPTDTSSPNTIPKRRCLFPTLMSEPDPDPLSEPEPIPLSEPGPVPLSEPAETSEPQQKAGIFNPPATTRLKRTRKLEPAPGLSEPAPGLLSEPPESMKSAEMEIPGPPATKRLKRTRKLEPAPLSEPPDTRKSKKKKIIPGPPATQQVKRSRCPPSPWTPNLVEIRRRPPTATPPTCEIGVTTFTLRSKVATSPTLKSGVATSPSSGEAFSTSPERKKMRKKNRKRARCSGAAVPTPPERKMKKRARCCPVPLNNPLSVCRSQRATQGRKACVWCKQENEWMKTIWQCEACQVALCLIPGRNCFRAWHKTHKWNDEVMFSLFS